MSIDVAPTPTKNLRKPLQIAGVVIVVLVGLLFFLASLGGTVQAETNCPGQGLDALCMEAFD